MKKRIPFMIFGVLVGSILLGTGLGQTVGHIVDAQTQELPPPEAREYADLSDRLLSEFIIVHNDYTPSVLEERALVDPYFEIIGVQEANGCMFIEVQLHDGMMAFGYTPDARQPICMIWRADVQAYKSLPADVRFDVLRKDSEEAFGQKAETIDKELNIIIFRLTDEICTSIKLFPDGTVTVGTGFRKNYSLPSKKLGKDDA